MDTFATDSKTLLPHQQNLRGIVLALYLLFIAGFFTGMLTFVVAIIMGHVKKSDSVGTVYHSHITWFLTTCWVNVIAIFVLGPLLVFLFFLAFAKDTSGTAGFLLLSTVCGAIIIGMWSVYRIVKGIWLWSEARAVV